MRNLNDAQNPESGKNDGVFLACLPEPLKNTFNFRVKDSCFGPAGHDDFGVLQTEVFKREGDCLLTTTIRLMLSGLDSRDYYKVLEQNYTPQKALSMFTGEHPRLEFSCPVPGDSGKRLTLMRVGRMKDIEDLLHLYSEREVNIEKFTAKITEKYKNTIAGPPAFFFIHPPAGREAFMEKFHVCARPVFELLSNGAGGENPKSELAALHWLYAQATPVVSGGTAMANLVLYHMEHRLKQQGVEIDLPYSKKEVDLWSYAATSELSVHNERFCNGAYFDPTRTSADVENDIAEMLNGQDRLLKPRSQAAARGVLGNLFIAASKERMCR